jgi:DnaJ-class molecular chaperone
MGNTVTVETYTEVIIERNSGFLLVECRHCLGTGQKYPKYGKSSTHSNRKKQCPTCGGNGVNKVAISGDEGLYRCCHCNGTGQKYPKYGKKSTHSNRAKQCPTCSGKGVLALKSPRIECKHCDGTGQQYPKYGKSSTHSNRAKKCPTCKGSGSNSLDSVS